ncbi:MAG: substrate-binding domain-containing protein [Akkermansiaceae bacterium]
MKRIAILVETSLASGREILRGISRYLDERPDWSVFQHVGPLGVMEPASIEHWEGDGIIARINDQKMLDLITSKNLPVIDILGNVESSPFPVFKTNDVLVGQTVAEHFLTNAHRNLAFVGLENEPWSLEREKGFCKEASSRQIDVKKLHLKQGQLDYSGTEADFEEIKSWLSTLSTPVGVMVASDQFAPVLFEACHRLNLSIPEHVSVVGVDNDSPFCHLCRPRLSSVEPDHERVGYEAAKALGLLMNEETLPDQLFEVQTMTLHQRLSSDLLVVEDDSIRKALEYIRKHAVDSPNIDEVAVIAGLSRSVLQRRFRQQLNRTVGDIIMNEKLRLAREMLSQTNLPISQIAERSGFNCQEYMNHVFKMHLNTTPRRYRLGL